MDKSAERMLMPFVMEDDNDLDVGEYSFFLKFL